MPKILSTIGFAMATLAAARGQSDAAYYAGACYRGTGLPYEFRECGREVRQKSGHALLTRHMMLCKLVSTLHKTMSILHLQPGFFNGYAGPEQLQDR